MDMLSMTILSSPQQEQVMTAARPDDLSVMLPKTFGNYLDPLPSYHEQLTLDFSPSTAPPRKRWHNNGRSADFLADFLITCLPEVESDSDRRRQAEIKDAVSYIANELLENAMKYSNQIDRACTSINLYFDGKCILFLTRNDISLGAIAPFQACIEELLNEDPQELYITRLEESVESGDEGSGLGLLTMMNDYEAKVGWKFEQDGSKHESSIVVTTMVQLEI
jgi:hypothetical protein